MDNHVHDRHRVYVPVAMILTTCLSVVACAAPPQPPPSEIVGRWITDAESHRDRIFEVRKDAVIFGTGKYSAPRLHVLVRVEPKPDSMGWKACTLFYREDDGTIAELDLEYHSKPKAKIRFANHEESWFRSAERKAEDA